MARRTEHAARRPAFFKALKGDFSQHLRIPSAFIKKLNRRSLHICRLKDPSGQCLTVRLEKRGNRLFFHKGWEEFVKHHPLVVGDFLIFSYDGVSMFVVTIYKNLCENITAQKSRSETNATGAKRRVNYVVGSQGTHVPIPFQSDNSFVYKQFKSSALYELYIPMEMVKAEGLEAGKTIKIIDEFNMIWKLRLRGQADRVLMRPGLTRIFKANGTALGDTVIFEFVKPGVAQLHIIRAGTY